MIVNNFDRGPEGWCSYDYHATIVAGGENIFILATWEEGGGVGDSGYIWVDHTRWSADTPEEPLSILPLILYQSWVNADPVDLRDAEMSVYLHGDGLQLDGARCYFWVHGQHTRWHYTSYPLAVSEASWPSEPIHFTLRTDETLWHLSWSMDPLNPLPLPRLLGQVGSYGFSFVGFSNEVTGRLCMDEFAVRFANES